MGAFLAKPCPACEKPKACKQCETCPPEKVCETCPTCAICETCKPQKECEICSRPDGFIDGVWKIDPLEYRKAVVEKHPALANKIPTAEIISEQLQASGIQYPSLHLKQITPKVLRVHSNIPLGFPMLAGEKTPYVYFEIELQANGDLLSKKGFAGSFIVLRFNKEADQLALDLDVKNSRLPNIPAEMRNIEKLPPPLIFNRVESFSLEMIKEYQNENCFYPILIIIVLIVLFLLFGKKK